MFRNRPALPVRGPAPRADRAPPPGLPAGAARAAPACGSSTTATSAVVRDTKGKSRRNVELLRAQQAESAPSPFLHFNLGSEYFAAGDSQAALAEYERAWEMILAQPDEPHEFTPSLMSRMVKALRACGRAEDAIARADEGLTRFPGFTDLVYDQALAFVELQRRDEAIARFERCIEMGDAPARYTSLVGCGTYLPRISMAELHLQRGEVAAALPLLQLVHRSPPRVLRDRAAVCRCAARDRLEPGRGCGRGRVAGPAAEPDRAVHARDGPVRSGRRGRGRGPVPGGRRAPTRERRRARCSGRDAPLPAPIRRRRRRGRRAARSRHAGGRRGPQRAVRPARGGPVGGRPRRARARRPGRPRPRRAGAVRGLARTAPAAPAPPRRCSSPPCRCSQRCSRRCCASRTSRPSRRCIR